MSEEYATLEDNGSIVREGEVLGSYGELTQTLILPEGTHPKRKQSVLKFLADAGHTVETVVEQSEEEKEAVAESLDKARKKSASKATKAGAEESDRDFAVRTGVALPPQINPAKGDKTPAYVSWLREHRLDKYKTKFGIVAMDQKVPIYGERGEIIGQEIADIGRRQATGIRRLEERASENEEGRSWDA